MRVFVGIQLDEEWKDGLFAIQQRVQLEAEKGSFTRKENFHLTLRFIGEVEESLIPVILESLAQLKHPFLTLETTALNSFQKRSGLIPWVGLKPNPSLQELQQKVNQLLENSGIKPETLPYTPHLTLGRNVRIEQEKWQALVERAVPLMKQQVEGITLFQSHRINNQLTYTPIYTMGLEKN